MAPIASCLPWTPSGTTARGLLVHSLVHLSSPLSLPSSHCSPSSTTPSPQTGSGPLELPEPDDVNDDDELDADEEVPVPGSVVDAEVSAPVGPALVPASDVTPPTVTSESKKPGFGRVHAPNVTFTDSVEIELGGKRVRMDWLGKFNHSFDSSLITFPDANILFIVDAVTFGRMPHTEMDYELGLYEEWMAVIRRIEQESKNYEHIATGHGPMGTSENVTEWREYFEALEAAVAGGIESGQSLEQMMETIKIPEYSHWVSYDAWLPLNVRGMYHFLTD